MCGIVGGWRTQFSIQPDFQAGLAKLTHRGPNDRGLELWSGGGGEVVLGHTRLSIIDLSEAGHQPMQSRCGRYAIVFNGEIYNYRELRQELQLLGQHFLSDSDTEVLLASWITWGAACFERLRGMFAFVVFDKTNRTLTCVRDPFGIKPFFYSSNQAGFNFASEIPALLEMIGEKPVLNWQRSYDYLVHGDYDSGSETFFDGVCQLPPGHFLTVELHTGKIQEYERWWFPTIVERSGWKFDDAVEQVREQFLSNVKLHLRSDVPLGAALSGGIDSSAVVCAMRYVEPDLPINTFSFVAADSDVSEELWVDRVNAHVGAISHKVYVKSQELVRDLDDMIRSQGEPFGSTSIYAQYRVFKLARDAGITVTLDGQGADEMLAGYNGYPGQRLRSLIETGHPIRALQFLNDWGKWPGRNRGEAIKRLAAEFSGGWLYDALRSAHGDSLQPDWINCNLLRDRGVICRFPVNKPQHNLLGRRVVAGLAQNLSVRGLASLLRHGDRNSMRFSIESRVPFLTVDLADLLLSMPEEFLISEQGQTKHVFRAAMRGIVPDDVLDRQDKIGFATPERDWLLSMSEEVRNWLGVDLGLPFLKQNSILKEFDEIVAGRRRFSLQVWRWVNFSRWHTHFF